MNNGILQRNFDVLQHDACYNRSLERKERRREMAMRRKKRVSRAKEKLARHQRGPRSVFHMSISLYMKLVLLLEEETENLGYEDGRSIRIDQRLAVTLRYLATGRFYSKGLELPYELTEDETREMILETCEGMMRVIGIDTPQYLTQWKDIATKFQLKTKFPHCIGVLDGRYVHMTEPEEFPENCLNVGGVAQYSMVLITIVNADGEFIMAEIIDMNALANGDIFHQSYFYEKMQRHPEENPSSEPIYPGGENLPYVFVTGEAFESATNIMTAFTHEDLSEDEILFNKRLSSVREISENTLNSLRSRFQVLTTEIDFEMEDVETIAYCCCLLHNYIKKYGQDSRFNNERTTPVGNGLSPLPPRGFRMLPEAISSKKEFAKALQVVHDAGNTSD